MWQDHPTFEADRIQEKDTTGVPIHAEGAPTVEHGNARSISPVAFTGVRPYDVTPDGKVFMLMSPKGLEQSDKPTSEQINVVEHWFEELKQRVPVK